MLAIGCWRFIPDFLPTYFFDMAALICGSLAFDTIMTFEGRFAEQILPDQLHILNVSFLVPTRRWASLPTQLFCPWLGWF